MGVYEDSWARKHSIGIEEEAVDQTFTVPTFNRKSLSCYERTDLKSIFPQIIASLVAASFHIGNGISLAYSAIIIAQLSEPSSYIKTTHRENSWIASVLIIAVLFSSIFSGVLMDKIGRLNTIKIACIPGVIGWSVIALANTVPLIIIGRFVIGISVAWGTSPALVYISEIASSNIRMSLMAFAPTYVSLGMILMYLGGWLLPWRLLAWFSTIFMVIPCILCIFIHESPSWLALKGKLMRAQQSLEWLHGHQKQVSEKNETYAELSMIKLQEEQKQSVAAYSSNRTVKMVIMEFLKPTGYKPLLFLSGLFLFHHFSGVFITMFYSISFIKEAGTNMDAYVASILIGVVRLVMSILSLYLLNIFNRRTLLFLSCLGMAICMFVTGLYTKWIKEEITTQMWVPVVALLFYVVFSTLGLLNIPTMLIAELFPLEIRGIGYSITYCIYCGCMFGALQSYYNMNDYFGGATNLQWFFASVCLGGLLYTYLFIPETKGVKLDQITNYFRNGWIYVRHTRT